MVAVGDADALDVGCAESTPFEDAESVADGDADAVAVAVAVAVEEFVVNRYRFRNCS